MIVRVGTLGLVFSLLLGVLVTKLWFVQVAQGSAYEARAEGQQVKPVPTVSPRGVIVDREGRVAAGIERQPTLVVDPTRIGGADAVEALIQEIAGLDDGASTFDVRAMFDAARPNQVFPLKGLALDVDDAMFVLGNRHRFPGIEVEWTPVRVYPLGSIAAHVLGYAAAPSEEDLQARPGLDRNGIVGKAGVERFYDDWLQGERGRRNYHILPSGQIIGLADEQPAIPGHTLTLSLDLEVQGIVEQALRDGIELSRRTEVQSTTERPSTASTGSVVVLDARTGAVLAMANEPSYQPQAFVAGIAAADFQELLDRKAFNNLAIQGLFSAGSTFKAVTYLTAMQEGIFPEDATSQTPEGVIQINAEGRLDLARLEEQSQKVFYDNDGCRGRSVDLHSALEYSCNIYFWKAALAIWDEFKNTDKEAVIQDAARSVGFGSATGIDLPFEAGGRIPDRVLFEELKERQILRDPSEPNIIHPSRLAPGGLWVGGDLMNVSIGAGDVLVTPLQMALSYVALSTGRLYTPYVVEAIHDHAGRLVRQAEPTYETLDLPAGFIGTFKADLARVILTGTARDVYATMGNRAVVGGKSGTAEIDPGNKLSHSWFVGVAPLANPRYVVAVVVEEGGSGSRIAGSVTKAILQHLLGEEVTPILEDGELGTSLPWQDPVEEVGDEDAVPSDGEGDDEGETPRSVGAWGLLPPTTRAGRP